MKIGIIGSGPMGATLARHLAELGHRVSIANSRGPAEPLPRSRSRSGATPVAVAHAATNQDVVILAIPTEAVACFTARSLREPSEQGRRDRSRQLPS